MQKEDLFCVPSLSLELLAQGNFEFKMEDKKKKTTHSTSALAPKVDAL